MKASCANPPPNQTPPALLLSNYSNVVIRVTILDNIDSTQVALNLYYTEVRSQKTVIHICDFTSR